MVKCALVLTACAACAACVPDFDDTTSLVTEPRLLAARSEPAEVAPGAAIVATALWVTPEGPAIDAPLEWAFCTARKGFTEPGPVAPACLVDESPDLVAFGSGATASGAVPTVACRQFGPDAPDPVPGEAAGRPVDPDGTGGFYQPIRIRGDAPAAHYVLGEVRIRCGLPGATPAQAAAFRERYVPNTNPAIDALVVGDAELSLAELATGATATVARGATVELAVRWPACEEPPCAGSEPYLWFDPSTRRLTARREAMRASWFATAGAFDSGHSGRSEVELDTFAPATWTSPSEPGTAYLWVVLRDDRGGATWATVALSVE